MEASNATLQSGVRPPTPHRIVGSWHDKVWLDRARRAAEAVKLKRRQDHVDPDPNLTYLTDPHTISYRNFLRERFPKVLKDRVVSRMFLGRESIVIIPEEEANSAVGRLVIHREEWEGGFDGAVAVTLDSLFTASGEKGEFEEWVRNRFKVHVHTDLMYYQSPKDTFSTAVLEERWSSTLAVLPIEIVDNVTTLRTEVHLEVGELPLIDENGMVIINGVPSAVVHRLVQSPMVQFSMMDDMPSLELTTSNKLEILRIRIKSKPSNKATKTSSELQAGEVQIRLPRSCAVYHFVGDVLAAEGITDEELRRLKNGEEIRAIVAKDREKATSRVLARSKRAPARGQTALEAYRQWNPFRGMYIYKAGRQKYNQRLGLEIPADVTRVTRQDLFAAVDLMYSHSTGKVTLEVDDRDSFACKSLRSFGQALEQYVLDWVGASDFKSGGEGGTKMPLIIDMRTCTGYLSKAVKMDASIGKYLVLDNNRALNESTNALSAVVMGRKITQVGDGGLDMVKRILGIRLIHGSHYGRVCPIETGDGQNSGLVLTLAQATRVTEDGEMLTPMQRVVNGKRQLQEGWKYMSAKEQFGFNVAQFDYAHGVDGELRAPVRPSEIDDVGEDGVGAGPPKTLAIVNLDKFATCPPEKVDYICCAPAFSAATSLIPFLEHDDANRLLMGSKMQGQAVPCLWAERPVVGTGMEAHIAACSQHNIPSEIDGQVLRSESSGITVVAGHFHAGEEEEIPSEERGFLPADWKRTRLELRGEAVTHPLVDCWETKKHTLQHHSVAAQPGERVYVGDILAESSSTNGGELAIGKNMVVAYMPWQGYNYEDAIVISKRLVDEGILTSVHVEEIQVELRAADEVPADGIRVQEGTWVEEGDLLVDIWKEVVKTTTDEWGNEVEHRETVSRGMRAPPGMRGRVVCVKLGSLLRVWVASTRPIQVGDKLAGRHGNKGIISKIVDERDMPYCPDGTPVDLCLNPLGVPSRMNVGQIFECLLGLAGRWSGQEYRVAPFDEMFAEEATRCLVFDALERASRHMGKESYGWLLDPVAPGKTILFDGRTGEAFDQPVTVGVTYFLKLYHMVKDKIHARGESRRYNMVTMQPTKGRRMEGGMRVGEMEVSAFVGHGAHAALKEITTVKSDDVYGRISAQRSMINGEPVQLPQGAAASGYFTFQREVNGCGVEIEQGAYGQRDAATSEDTFPFDDDDNWGREPDARFQPEQPVDDNFGAWPQGFLNEVGQAVGAAGSNSYYGGAEESGEDRQLEDDEDTGGEDNDRRYLLDDDDE